jgi:hypothetical protein
MRTLSWSLLTALVLVTGCTKDEPDTGFDGVDADNDGYFEDEDCDDNDATAYPGATEYCDGVDNDCNELVDDEPTDGAVYYRDGDQDGYGDDATQVLSCEAPEGYIEVGGDCDDTDADFNPLADESDCTDPNDYNCDGSVGFEDADGDGFAACEECRDDDELIYPDADEICDDQDNNCDGVIDEPTAVDAATWYLDADSDSYGNPNPAFSQDACDQPEGYVDNDQDCDDLDADINPLTTWYADVDEDGYGDPDSNLVQCETPEGYVLDDQDCDDADGDRNPETVWFEDSDTDGYGATTDIVFSCEQPTGYADNANDCDDGDSSANPGGTETCDLVDNDCNGTVDDSYATDATTWYSDSDSDTYGDASVSISSCTQPSGYVADSTDCDDALGDVNPGAVEVCNDGIDNDCVTGLDFCSLTLDQVDTTLVGEAAADNFGNSVSPAGDLDGNGTDELIVGAYHESTNATQSGAVYLFDGVASGTVDASTADAVFYGDDEKHRAGGNVLASTDVDGDGQEDLLITALRASGGGNTRGSVYVMLGGAAFSGAYDLETDADYIIDGEGNYDRLGSALLAVGDLDGDSTTDVAMSALYEDFGAGDGGAVYILDGITSSDDVASAAVASVHGEVSGGTLGGAVGGGTDVDGDTYDDLIIGYDEDSSSAGSVGVFYGPLSTGLLYSDADVSLTGENSSDLAGNAVAGIRDLDGDGYDELLVGAPGEDTGGSAAGKVYLMAGPVTSGSLSGATASWTGESAGDSFGTQIQTGDFDGDGTDDLLIAAPNYGSTDEGAAYVIYGGTLSGSLSASDADLRLVGAAASDGAGSSIAVVGDTDGDSAAELFVGAIDADGGGSSSGAGYLLLGVSE